MAKIVQCGRCKGKGHGSWRVVHCGMPGGCYQCDLSGSVVRFTMAERVRLYLHRCEQGMKEAEAAAVDVKAAIAALDPKVGPKMKPARIRLRLRHLEGHLETLRERWNSNNREWKRVNAENKVDNRKQPASMPSRFQVLLESVK